MPVAHDSIVLGDALLIAGHVDEVTDQDDTRIPLLTKIGEVLMGSGSPWRIRRLASVAADREQPSRPNVRREIDALLTRASAARVVVISADVLRTVEGLALACGPSQDGFPEDTSVPLRWIGERLRQARTVPTAFILIARGTRASASALLDLVGTGAAEHLIAAIPADADSALRAVLDGLWSDAIDLTTGTVTLRSLSDHVAGRFAEIALQATRSEHTLLAPRGHAQADLAVHIGAGPGPEPDDLIGTVLPGRFRVLDELGRGGFGIVYRAHHDLMGRDVAVKVLPPRLGAEAIRRFVTEVRALGSLDHRGIVRVFHADVTRDGRLFLAMELLHGTVVSELLRHGPAPPAHAVRLVQQLVDALAAAHAAGIMHGDVSPTNAMVIDGAEPRLVLLDFGLSRMRARPSSARPFEPVDPTLDVFDGARVALALLTGAAVATAGDREAALAAVTDEHVRRVLRRALADDRGDRFVTAVELAQALAGDAAGPVRPPLRPPFRLAAAFTEHEHRDFHGRDQEVERLLEHVLFRRALVYVAPSGTGKTSLLRAGLIPRLQQLDVDVAYLACRRGVASDVVDRFAGGVASVADPVTRRASTSTRRLVLIVDQVESAVAGAVPDGDGEPAIEGLGVPRWPVDAPVSVVWCVREEYLARLLDRVQRLEPGLPIVRLGALAPGVARDILRRTLADRGVTIDPALVDAIVGDLVRAAAGLSTQLAWGDEPAVYPPHLQLAGVVLYEARDGHSLDLALYRRVGGLATILAEHLHRVLEDELGGGDTAIARDVLLALVGSLHTRVACEEPELMARALRADATRTAAAVESVLQFLRDRGLIVAAPGPQGEPVWDLAHDSLVAQVERWVTVTDLDRLRAVELLRYHLRRSRGRELRLLNAVDLQEVQRHLSPEQLRELDGEWSTRAGADPAAATRLVDRSRRSLLHRRVSFTGFALLAATVAALLGLRWREERALRRQQLTLRDRDIGTTLLVLRAFDWEPGTLTPHDVTAAQFTWRLVRPLATDHDRPGAPFARGDLTARPVPAPAGALRADRIDARGGPAVLIVERRDRAGRACADLEVPIESLPGYTSPPRVQELALRLPTCEASAADTIEVPEGFFVAGGVGEPPSRDQIRYPESNPERRVDLQVYWLDRTELTNAALAAVRDAFAAGGRSLPVYPQSDELQHAGLPDRPVSSLTWREAAAVCRLFGKRLPTSDEWQKALRGGLMLGGARNPHPRRNLPWGRLGLFILANINHGGPTAPAPVGSYPVDRGPYGHLDLAGNLMEWTADVQPDGLVIMRGGNWSDTNRGNLLDFGAIVNPRPPKASMFTFGFRCAAGRLTASGA